MNVMALLYAQKALRALEDADQGFGAAACHLDAALNAMGYTPAPVDLTSAATVLFDELMPA